MSALGYIAATILWMVYTCTLSGWALSILWSWFMVAVFALPALTIPQAIGVSLVVSYLTHQVDHKDDRSRPFGQILLHMVAYGTLKPLSALAFGAVVKGFM